MSETKQLSPDRMQAYFDGFSRRFLRKDSTPVVDVEVLGMDIGDQVEGEGVRLIGITYEPRTRALEVELESAGLRAYRPKEVWAIEEDDGFIQRPRDRPRRRHEGDHARPASGERARRLIAGDTTRFQKERPHDDDNATRSPRAPPTGGRSRCAESRRSSSACWPSRCPVPRLPRSSSLFGFYALVDGIFAIIAALRGVRSTTDGAGCSSKGSRAFSPVWSRCSCRYSACSRSSGSSRSGRS